MARRRMVTPRFWTDKEFFNQIIDAVQKVTGLINKKRLFQWGRNVRLFFIALWNFADDEGRFETDLVRLKGETLPYDDDFSQKVMQTALDILSVAKKVGLYSVGGVGYGVIRNFKKHQTISHPTPSIIPAPPEGIFANVSRTTPPQVKLSKVKQSNTAGPVRQTSSDPIQNEAEKVVTRWERKIPGVKLNYGLVKNMLMGQKGFEVLLCGTLERFVDRLAIEVKVKKVKDPLTRFIDMAHKPAGYLE